MKMTFFQKKIYLIFILTLLNGCDNSGPISVPVKTVTGTFIDDVVQGVDYLCSSGIEGKTNVTGEYSCDEGDKITFILGKKKLGTFTVQNTIITPYSFYPDNLNAALNLARFLQAVDSDKDPNNGIIVIDKDLQSIEQIDFHSITFNKDVESRFPFQLATAKEAQDRLHKGIVSAGYKVPEGTLSAETSPPIITLHGDSSTNIVKGSSYIEAGATTSENIEVTISGVVDTSTAGDYIVTYSATDSFGNRETINRTVHVLSGVTIKSAPTISGKSITKILSANNEAYSIDSKATLLTSNTSDFLILALNDEDTLEYLGLVSAKESQTVIDSTSTALSLLVLFPYITPSYYADSGTVRGIISKNAEVALLSQLINVTPLWSDMVNPDLIEAYGNAIISVLTEINLLKKNTTIQARNFSKTPSDELTKSGVEFLMDPTTNDKLTLVFKNNYSRWIVAIAGPLNNPDENLFEPLLIAPNKDKSRGYDKLKIPEEGLIVAVLGPGVGFPSDKLPNGTYKYYATATVYSLANEVGIPVISLITGSSTCVENMFSPVEMTHELLGKILVSEDFENSIKSSSYIEAGLDVIMLGLKSINDGAISCFKGTVVKQVAPYLIPILGEVKVLMTVSELTVKLAPFASAWATSNKYEFWTIENKLNSSFEMEGVNFLPTNLELFGQLNYTKSIDIPSPLQSKYQGNCPAAEDNTYCEGYTFDGDGPYTMAFTLKCRNPNDESNIPCFKAIFSPTENALNSRVIEEKNGVINFTHNYTEAKEYHGSIEVVDADQAVNRYEFYVQIKKSEPQVVIKHNSGVIPYFTENDQLENTSPFEILCCQDGLESTTETFELFNKGNSEAVVNIIGPNLGQGDFSLVKQGNDLTIPPSGSLLFDIKYTEDGTVDPYGYFKIQGKLGGESLPRGPSLQSSNYSTIIFNTKVKTNSRLKIITPSNGDIVSKSIIKPFIELDGHGKNLNFKFYIDGNSRKTDSSITDDISYWRYYNELYVSGISNGEHSLKASVMYDGTLLESDPVTFIKQCDDLKITLNDAYCSGDYLQISGSYSGKITPWYYQFEYTSNEGDVVKKLRKVPNSGASRSVTVERIVLDTENNKFSARSYYPVCMGIYRERGYDSIHIKLHNKCSWSNEIIANVP